MRIILASASDRRKKVFEKLGLKFEVIASDVDEVICNFKTQRLLLYKAS